MQKFRSTSIILLLIIISISCVEKKEDQSMNDIDNKISQYADTYIKYDESLLDANQKIVVSNLYKAAKVMDEIFLEQVYSQNNKIKSKLLSSENPLDKKLLDYFNINFGPFDRLEDNKSFMKNISNKPPGANFYPEDMTKEEFENYISNKPEKEESFTSEFTMIRRKNGDLTAIPHSKYFEEKLTKASTLLREAADYADNQSLKKYLLTRATAFETNDYFESDLAWMDLKDHTIEIVIGPYEVYEDELFNYKASFECFLTIVDPEGTEKLQQFANYLNDIENNLPIPDNHKNFDRGSESPIVVVQEVFSAGDTKAGVQTLAFNLPNDERVREAKGSKKVMLKNIHEAKFEKLLKPISKIVLDAKQLEYVSFDGFFNHTLMHEMSHGIGPGIIQVNGRTTEVKKELKETYSTIEECKADILGMYNNMLMIEKGVYPKSYEKELWVTFLAGIFRSIRFGINAAHGGGNAIIYNCLLEDGAYEYDGSNQNVKVNFEKVYDSLKKLANKVLMIQAEGNYNGSKQLIEKYAVESESMKKLVKNLIELPVDIHPIFQIEKNL
ncbi:peptidase [Bacteroidota bacterium]